MEKVYRSFYTKSDFITDYMVKMLDLKDNDLVLEPSGGDGVFIDSLLNTNKALQIETCDINEKAVKILQNKYKNKDNIKIWETDTLLDETFDEYAENNGYYDKIIGNPPYGGWQDFQKRDLLKKKYNGHYVKETYSLFMLRCISLLKNNGILTFIVPDTFLYLHRHTALREYLLTNTKIKEILIFPSKFFPGVSFGYSKLSIVTVQKVDRSKTIDNTIRIIEGFNKEEDLDSIRLNEEPAHLIIKKVEQKKIFDTKDHTFLLNKNEKVLKIINEVELKLGDIADCVTGIYTGNNTKYIKAASKNIRGAKNYDAVKSDEINIFHNENIGIKDKDCFIPIVKGSSKERYLRPNINWYIDWSEDALYHYNNDKKARFQNSQFYFKTGIALPMVKSSQIRATKMSNMVFDQSIVGVFPKEKEHVNYLLGLLNSDIAKEIIHTINPTANNSANYIKKIPVIIPDDDELLNINKKVEQIIKDVELGKDISKKQEELNSIFEDLYMHNLYVSKVNKYEVEQVSFL